MPKATPTTNSVVLIPPMRIERLNIRLVSDSALICHAWSHKAKAMMLDKQMGKAKEARARKDPQRDFEESLYPFPGGGYGFPSVAFKAAAVDACSHVKDLTKVVARGAFHIDQELLHIDADEPTMREDMVKIALGTADIRYRGQFNPWSVVVPLRYNTGVLTADQVVQLFNCAGFAVGVGEWRPQRDGQFGMFHVEGL